MPDAPASQSPASDEGAKVPRGVKRERSTIRFPYDDLQSAIGVAHAVHVLGGRCETDQLAGELKYSSVDNGAFRMRVATARTFGLITTARDGISLTPTGRKVVDPGQEADGRVEAFLNVPLYLAVYDRFRGGVLPPASGLENVFDELGVASKQTDKARQAFQRSAEQAGFFSHGNDRLIAPTIGPRPSRGEEETRRSEASGTAGYDDTAAVGPDASSILSQPLVRGLIEALPEPGSEWSDGEREEWLTLARSIFGFVYKTSRPALTGPKALEEHGWSGGGEST